MTRGLLDWRPEGSPEIVSFGMSVARSLAEQLLRDARESDRANWCDTRDESLSEWTLSARVQKRAMPMAA